MPRGSLLFLNAVNRPNLKHPLIAVYTNLHFIGAINL